MASSLAVLGNTHKFHRFFDFSVFAAITAGYIVLVGFLASAVGTSNGTPGPEAEPTPICQCSSKDDWELPLEAGAADVQWTSTGVATPENCS